MSRTRKWTLLFSAGLLTIGTSLGGWTPAGADGTEELGAPSIAIESGSGIAVAGVGLRDAQPAAISVEVPAGSVVKQVLLYWEGQSATPVGDDTIVVDGTEVTGTLIGGPTFFFRLQNSDFYTSTYRADITALGAVAPGVSTLSVGGLTFDQVNDGAGLTVIYDDGTSAEISLLDGVDTAFINFPPPRDTTVAKTFSFAPAAIERIGSFSMHFSSVVSLDAGGDRPEIIEITIDGVTTQFPDLLASFDGNEWDTRTIEFPIPAGATEATVQTISADSDGDGQDPLAASLVWVAANLSVPVPPPPTTLPPVTVPPTTLPPVTVPPTTLPPVTVPPTTVAPTTTENIPPIPTTTFEVITPIPETTPPTTEPPAPTTTLAPTVILPETGPARTGLPLGTGLIALGVGLALVSLAQRRPSTSN